MRIVLILAAAAATTATCLSDKQCMDHGVCNEAKTRCKCDQFWVGPNCTLPLSSRASTPLYAFFRWGGLTWYSLMTLVIARCMWRIHRFKSLKYVCLSYRPLWDRGGGVETDPQQLTLVFVFLHCFLCTIEYASDPAEILHPSSLVYQWTLIYFDLLCLMCSVFTMVRYWVKLRASFSQIANRVARVFDWTSVILISMSLILAIFRPISWGFRHNGVLTNASLMSAFVFEFFVLFYFLFVLGFALYYGVQLLRYLQTKRTTTQISVRPLRKLTLLMFAMMFAVALGCGVSIYATFLNQTADEDLTMQGLIALRICIGIFIITVPVALGSLSGEQPTHPASTNQHGSKRSPTKNIPRGFSDDVMGDGPKSSDMTPGDTPKVSNASRLKLTDSPQASNASRMKVSGSPKQSNGSQGKLSLPDVELSVASAHPNQDVQP